MKPKGKTVMLIGVFSILLTGCYSSTMIDPRGDEQEKMYTKTIKKVVTKEGTTYLFGKSSLFRDEPTTIVKDSIVGYSDGKRVSLPLSEASEVYVMEFQPVMTAVAVLGGVGIVVGLIAGFNALSDALSFGGH